jgi:hypothetical protein
MSFVYEMSSEITFFKHVSPHLCLIIDGHDIFNRQISSFITIIKLIPNFSAYPLLKVNSEQMKTLGCGAQV